jgi:Tol biopolymer transport system component
VGRSPFFREQVFVFTMESSTLRQVTHLSTPWFRPISWSADGRQLAFPAGRGQSKIIVAGVDGSSDRAITSARYDAGDPTWSPDGKRIAFGCRAVPDERLIELTDICIVNADGSGEKNVTNHTTESIHSPHWSPDGRQIVMFSGSPLRVTDSAIAVLSVDTFRTRKLTASHDNRFPSWSPDGKRIVFTSGRNGNQDDIYTMNADCSGQVRLTKNGSDNTFPLWSPDGKMISFESNLTGTYELYVMKSDGSQQKQLTKGLAVAGRVPPCWVN